MNVKEITDKAIWENFLVHFPIDQTPFFQSFAWGEIQKSLGNSVVRFGLFEHNALIGICLGVIIHAKRGTFLHLRHGPLINEFFNNSPYFLSEIISYAKEKKLDFIRMSVCLEESEALHHLLSPYGFRNAPIHNMDAENAWVLDLQVSEDELLKGMRKTTRYLVRKAQTLPIEVSATNSQVDFNDFMKLYEDTSKRHHFVPHKGLLEEFKLFVKENNLRLYIARFEKKVIAGAFIVWYGNQAVYHHGATSDEYKDIPAAYLLQWEAIKDAKKIGKKIYNFWGVVPEDKQNHPWRGLSLFKMGFGGRRVNFLHAQDLPLRANYWKTFFIETYTKKRKGY